VRPPPRQAPEVVRLAPASADALRVELVPELGAKITSLRLGSGPEWLAAPVRPLTKPAPNQDWAELDCSGWDECFPNVAPSASLGLPDHGEVWRHPWTLQLTETAVSTQIVTDRYSLQRRLTVSGCRLVIDYRLQNLGSERLDWAWAQHPLLAVAEHTRLVLPASTRVRVDSAFLHGAASTDADWLCPAGTLAAETNLSMAGGRAAKLWFEHPPPSALGVLSGDDWLAWQVADVTDVGLWVNLGGWGSESLTHLAVEPAFGHSDDPEIAYAAGPSDTHRALAPGAGWTWQVVIEAGRGRPALARALTARG
jgi:hypothetical protein